MSCDVAVKVGDLFVSRLGSLIGHYAVTSISPARATFRQISAKETPSNFVSSPFSRAIHHRNGRPWVALTCYQTAHMIGRGPKPPTPANPPRY